MTGDSCALTAMSTLARRTLEGNTHSARQKLIVWLLDEQSDGAPDGTDALAVGPDGRLVAVGTRYDGSDADPWITVAELEGSD